MNHLAAGTSLTLLPQKALYIAAHKILILSDVHLGKATHFQKAGVAIPFSVGIQNMTKIIELVSTTNPKEVIFLGDLFHSEFNNEWSLLVNVIEKFPQIKFTLVEGNHDILPVHQYLSSGLHVVNSFKIDNLLLTHHPEESPLFNLCGHLHPGITLSGKGRQRMRLPVFWFTQKRGVLPAFGNFTGLSTIKSAKTDDVYAVGDDMIFKL